MSMSLDATVCPPARIAAEPMKAVSTRVTAIAAAIASMKPMSPFLSILMGESSSSKLK